MKQRRFGKARGHACECTYLYTCRVCLEVTARRNRDAWQKEREAHAKQIKEQQEQQGGIT